MKHVAHEANVSVGTVSRVFNNHKNVTKEIRLRVLKAASFVGYFGPNGQDTHAPDGNRALREIGFFSYFNGSITTLATNPFWSHILQGVESEARKSNIKVTYHSSGELLQTPQMLLTT